LWGEGKGEITERRLKQQIMNIVLIGYRGTGKSTVAGILGQRLKRSVISTDAEIVKEAGQSIPSIVKQFGWDHFRGLETQMCRKLTNQENLVIDTGGGLILKEENVKILKANGKIFWLTAEVSTIASRISGDTERPSLSGTKTFVEEIEEILEIRRPHYQAAADVTIPTDNATPESIANQILGNLDFIS
jgi:shikimate kinase